MKKNKITTILCVAVILVLVAVIVIVAACSTRGVDKEYQYNTEIITNPNAPDNSGADIESISDFVEDTDQDFIDLPYTVDDTDIEIIAIGKYTGAYSEVSDTDEVEDVLAIVVKNNSQKVVSYSSISVDCGNGIECSFSPTNLPSGQSSLVFTNSNAVSYADVTKFECVDSMFVMADELSMLDGKVGIDYKDGEFIVTNLTGDNLGDVYIRYKNCSDGNVYLGGVTHSTVVKNVEPFETYKVSADSFDEQTSVIIAVESITQ